MTTILSALLFAAATIIGYQWLVIRAQRTTIAVLSRLWLIEKTRNAATRITQMVPDVRHIEWKVADE